MSFDTYYPLTPFDGMDTFEAQTYYYPELREKFVAKGTYAALPTIQTISPEMGRSQTTTDLIAPEPDHEPSDERIQWREPMYFDTYERRTAVNTFTGKIAMHNSDNLYVAFKRAGARGLIPIARGELGDAMITQMNKRARNIFLTAPNQSFGAGAVSNTTGITTSHLLDADYIDGVWGLMAETGRPYQADPYSQAEGSMVCYTSPGALYDLKQSLATQTNRPIIDVKQYASMGIIPYKGEVFSWNNIRFVSEPLSILWNSGEVFYQPTITAPLIEGDGSPDPNTTAVKSVYYMGQKDKVLNHYIQLSSTTGLQVGDVITIHTARMPSSGTPVYGVANGVDWRHSKSVQRTIVGLPGSNRIQVDKPVMKPYSTDLGGGVYGYVTKGRHIHSALTLNKGDGVKMIVREPNRIIQPQAIDDFETMWRVSWIGHWDFNVWDPDSFHIGFFAGTNFKGSTLGYIS